MQPCYKFLTNTPAQQITHVRREASELLEAYLDGDIEHAIEEMWDVIQSCYTLKAIWDKEGYNTGKIKIQVLEKNFNRGYYDACTDIPVGAAEISE